MLQNYLWAHGPVGLQNAASYGLSAAGIPASCEDCVCGEFCTVVDFAAGQQDWVAGPNAFISWSARYVAGSGWGTQADDEVINISYALGADIHFTHVKLNVIGTGGVSVAYDGFGITFYKDGVLVLNINNPNTHQNWNLDQAIDLIADTIYIAGNVSVGSGSNYLNFRVTSAEFSGDGPTPFIGTDCP
jgi:hypothetical protein